MQMNEQTNRRTLKSQRQKILKRFKRTDSLVTKKLLAYIPVMIFTNLSTLLLISVDGIVVGNLLGANALASVNIFYPASILIGVASDWVAGGISIVLSVSMGKNDHQGILNAKLASKQIMIISAFIVSLVQIPLFAFGLTKFLPAAWLWAAYTLTELTLLSFNLAHYRKRLKTDSRELEDDIGLFYLTLKPDEAIEASEEIHAYADKIGFEKKYSYRIALCIEEMVAYVKSSQKNGNINIQIIIRFQENGVIFMMLDDGKCIALDDVKETQKLITGNYDLIKKLANTVEYQYLQNMNYSVLTFDCPMRHKQEERT